MPDTAGPLVRRDLAQVLRTAAVGEFPPADGGFSRAAPWRPGTEAAVALTGHAIMVVGEDVPDADLRALGVHGLGGAHDPRATLMLAGAGEVGILDVLLLRHGTGADSPLVPRADLATDQRAQHAAQWRDEVRVFGFADPHDTSLATVSRGIAGLPEVGIQCEAGDADRLLRGALALVSTDEVALASVSPGNARSLRFFLRHGFRPVGSVQLWHPDRRLSR